MTKTHPLLKPEVFDYLSSMSQPLPDEAIALYKKSIAEVEHAEKMIALPEQAQWLAWIIEMHQVQRCIEVGMFTGFSTLMMALALPPDGLLIGCDKNPQWVDVGRPYWQAMGVDHKIDCRIGSALDTLQQLVDDDHRATMDMIFLDADKIHYAQYYERALLLLRQGGVLVIDNTLWLANDFVSRQAFPAARSVHAVNQTIQQDARVTAVTLPVGSGMTMVMKRR